MATWLKIAYERLRGSLWFLPTLMALAAVVLALLCARLDAALQNGFDPWWVEVLYRGESDSARTLLSTVAGSMITVAGVTFSATMVALSLASSQLGPRLLVSFMRDRGNQVVLGGFIATFLFCLLALGETRAVDRPLASSSVTVALGLAVGSLLLFIYFIHHIASSMQADKVIALVTIDVRRHLDRIFPAERRNEPPVALGVASADDAQAEVSAPDTGYLQAVDEAGLLEIAVDRDVCLHLLRRPGHHVALGDPLVRASAPTLPDDAVRRIQSAFLVGGSRTAEQDPEYGVHQLVEIALRALSPGLNDPYTAITCIDHLAGSLAEVASRPERPPVRIDEHGTLRLTLSRIDFGGIVDAAFSEIRQSSVAVPSVSIRLLEALATIARHTEDPDRLASLTKHAQLVYEGQREQLSGMDRDSLEDRYQAFRRTCREAG